MAGIGVAAAQKLMDFLQAPAGVAASVAELSAPERALTPEVVMLNGPIEMPKYPIVTVYCEKITNVLREKFRTFSGTARLAMEVRVSQDRLDDIQRRLHLYVDAVTGVLERNRGDWGQGMFYAGGYEVGFGVVKHGGKNFVQSAKVSFDVEISR